MSTRLVYIKVSGNDIIYRGQGVIGGHACSVGKGQCHVTVGKTMWHPHAEILISVCWDAESIKKGISGSLWNRASLFPSILNLCN